MDENGLSLEPLKTEKVFTQLRSNIVSGRYSPGYRLPTYVEMEGDFAVGRAVLQHAIEALKRDGFVRSEGRRGLFVTENPPHLYQYGLVMPSTPGDAGWCHLMIAITNEAHRLEKADVHRRFRFYYGIDTGDDGAKSLEQLREDALNHRLAGLIIHHDSAAQVCEALGADSRLPRVYLWADPASGVAPGLTVDGAQLIERSLAWLKSRGRRRIAMLQMGGTNIDFDHQRMYAEAGLEYHAPWVQWVGRSEPETAERLVALLMDYRREEQPDALIVTDDNLVPYVSSGLVAARVKVGEQLELVSHCNWPWPPRSVLPMVRIGFDMREVMRRAMLTLELQREGKTPETYQRVPPQFEWETDHIGQ